MTEEINIFDPMTLKKPGRRFNPDRHRPDGTYDSKPLDPLYFKKYYKEKVPRNVPCTACGLIIADSSHMSRHKKTKTCIAKSKLFCPTIDQK